MMDARALRVLYDRQLAEDLEPPVAEHVNRLGTRAMLRASSGLRTWRLCRGTEVRERWSGRPVGGGLPVVFADRRR